MIRNILLLLVIVIILNILVDLIGLENTTISILAVLLLRWYRQGK